jgi:hypothetical protein
MSVTGRAGYVRAEPMKGLLTMVLTAAAVMAAVYVFRSQEEDLGRDVTIPSSSSSSSSMGEPAPGQDTRPLRDQLLQKTWGELGVRPVHGVWGVLMERGYEKGVATVVGLADGTASLYLNTGQSVLGGRAFPRARDAAIALCGAGVDSLADTIPAHEFPLPAKGRVRFYVLTDGGVRTAEGDAAAHGHDGGRDPLAALATSGQTLVDALREATAKGLTR